MRVGCQWGSERRPFEFRSIVTYRRKPPAFVSQLGQSLAVHVKRTAPQSHGQRKRSRTESSATGADSSDAFSPSVQESVDG